MSNPPHPVQPRHEFVRFACAATVAAAALAVILIDLGDTPLTAVARLAAAVSLVTILLWFVERRISRRLERIERWIDRTESWRVYAAVMADLGGVDGETSGEIPTGPRR